MDLIGVPYHLDEYLPDLDLPLHPDRLVVAAEPIGDVWDRLAAIYDRVADEVTAAVGAGGCPFVMAGDCTTSLGTVAGLQRTGIDAGIVWFDAHGDVQTLETTTSGYLGGLPLRLLVGYRPELIAERLGLHPVLESRVALVGARDLDPPEVEYLSVSQIGRFEVPGFGAQDAPSGPLYVHLDVDVFDPVDVPGLRFPAAGGPDADAVADALRALLGTGRVAALSVACTGYASHDAGLRMNRMLENVFSSR